MKHKKTTDLSLTLTAFLMIILMLILMYWFSTSAKEKYAIAPVFEFSPDSWYTPKQGNYISRYHHWKVSEGNMTISFDIKINTFVSYWRNIFRFLMPYEDWWEDGTKFGGYDYYRRAAIFIIPNQRWAGNQKNGLHITFDTTNTSNYIINIPMAQVEKEAHNIGCVWKKENTIYSLTVFVDFVQYGKYYYDSALLLPDPDALFYCSDTMYACDGYELRNLKVFNTPMSLQEYKDAVPRLAQ